MASLEGKVALVTGASRGIGRAIALELARQGAKVALNYRTGEAAALSVVQEMGASVAGTAARGNGESVAQVGGEATLAGTVAVAEGGSPAAALGETVMLAQADISVPQEARAMVARVVEKWGRLDILVNNAGITRDKTLRKLTDEDWQMVINTNLNSCFYCTSAAVPVMIEQKYGRIVNIGSLIGQSGNIGQCNYAAAKAGMIAFAKSAALELARFNINVNVINPGFTFTEMMAVVPENIQDQIKAKIPLARFAKPEEIARAVLYLLVDGDYITGQQIDVNGGARM